MKIIEYRENLKNYFIDLNKEWIFKYFGEMESDDFDTFNNTDKIVSNGGMILFAVNDNNDVLAVCMVKPLNNDGVWELCKLAANNNIPHKGAGTAVFEASVKWAENHGAKKILILSNSKLKAAIHIYRKHNFKEIPIFDDEYKRVDIAFELNLTNT